MQAKPSITGRDTGLQETMGVPPASRKGSPRADFLNDAGSATSDLRARVTDRFVAMLAQGAPVFRERWSLAARHGVPCNGLTGAPYRGINVLLFWEAAIEQGHTFNVWLTYKQAARLGGQVRKGEKGVMGVLLQPSSAHARARSARDKGPISGAEGAGVVCQPFWVFNVAQIAGLPDRVSAMALIRQTSSLTPIAAAEALLVGSGATLRHSSGQACYAPAHDEIALPSPHRFRSAEAYYACALHALVYWTGHPSRLGRFLGRSLGDENDAFEALVAELGRAFVMAHLGLDATVTRYPVDLSSWLAMLRKDCNAIFVAAGQAVRACDYLLAMSCGTQAKA